MEKWLNRWLLLGEFLEVYQQTSYRTITYLCFTRMWDKIFKNKLLVKFVEAAFKIFEVILACLYRQFHLKFFKVTFYKIYVIHLCLCSYNILFRSNVCFLLGNVLYKHLYLIYLLVLWLYLWYRRNRCIYVLIKFVLKFPCFC